MLTNALSGVRARRSTSSALRRAALSPLTRRHSRATSWMPMPRNSRAPSAGRSTAMPLRRSRPSVAAARSLSPSSVVTCTPPRVSAALRPAAGLRSRESLSRIAARTESTLVPSRMYSPGSSPKLRQSVSISAARRRSANTGSSAAGASCAAGAVCAGTAPGSFLVSIPISFASLSVSISIARPRPTEPSAGTGSRLISYGVHLMPRDAGPSMRPSGLLSPAAISSH